MQQFLYIGGLQDLAHGNYLLIDHQSRHTHNAILHDLLHISHILDFDCKTQILYRSLGCFIQIVAVLAAGTQNLDGVLTAAASILCLGRRATATADLFCLGCSAAAAATGFFLYFLLFAKVKQCHNILPPFFESTTIGCTAAAGRCCLFLFTRKEPL